MILDAPAIFESDRLAQCSTQADLAYPRLLGISDDWGRAEWNPRKILARAFPKRPQIRESDVRRWLLEYDEVRSPKDPGGPGLLRRYVVREIGQTTGGVEYFEWVAWKGVSPSKRRFMRCPPPPWAPPGESIIWEKSRFHQTAKRRRRHLNKEPNENHYSRKSTDLEHETEAIRFRQGPAVPADNDNPPTPPAGAGGSRTQAGRPPSGSNGHGHGRGLRGDALEDAVNGLVAHWRRLGSFNPGRPTGWAEEPATVPRETNIRAWRRALRTGRLTAEEFRRGIADRVHGELIRLGVLSGDETWPPTEGGAAAPLDLLDVELPAEEAHGPPDDDE